MTPMLFTAYVLVWPLLAALVMLVLCIGLYRDVRHARRSGKAMV